MSAQRLRERGAAAVETALLLTLLFTLAVGSVETAVLVLDKLAVGNATREGARVGALAGTDPSADSLIVSVVERALCAQDFGTASKLVIFEAGADGSVPGHVPASDPAYASLDLNLTRTYVASGTATCDDGSTVPNFVFDSGAWDPSSRSDTFAGGLDDLGVLVLYAHEDITGFVPFLAGTSYAESTVMRIEPDVRG